jgi:hypothetical protein
LNLRTLAFAALATIAFGTSAVSVAQTPPGSQGTPPPPPVPVTTSSPLVSTSPEPTPLPSAPGAPTLPPTTPTPGPQPSLAPTPESSDVGGRGRHRRGGGAAAPSPEASPSETPEPPQFSTLDGVWEVALQPLNGARAIYSHLYVTQKGDTLTGTWKRGGKEPALPFTGTFDGRLFKLSINAKDKTEILSGYEENFMDMVGLYTDGDPKKQGVPFTAGHRKSARERERDENSRDTPRPPSGAGRPPGGIPPR